MRLRSIIILTLVLGLGVVGYHVWRISQEEAHLAALHEAMGPCAIGSNPSWQLPMFILEPINRWIYGDIALTPALPPPPPPPSLLRTARDAVHTAAYRLRSFVQGYCDGLFIYGEVSLEESFESKLARFQGLKSISLTLPDDSPSNRATIERFCTAVHALPKLEQLQFAAPHMEDAWIAPLRGHPTLRVLKTDRADSKLSPRCIDTLRTLPALQELRFLKDPFAPGTPLSTEEIQALAAALPSVQVYIGDTKVIKPAPVTGE